MMIDAHQHFWRYDPEEYGWIDEPLRVLRRDFLPAQLRAEIASVGVAGVVAVQARQNLSETGWLLDLADQHDFIKGVVGWVELIAPEVGIELAHFSVKPKLKSVRHVVQGEPDDNFILRDDFNRGIRELKRFGLAYDLLIFARHLPQTIQFVDAHPHQVFILDHIAKPRVKDGQFEPWNKNIRALAQRQNVYCKVSGMVTEADQATWTAAQLQPYFETVLEAFGPRRLMFGSDWPVCLVACGYARWHQLVAGWIAKLAPDEQARVLGGTAVEAYKL
jgi:L-fuconolactonase